MRSRSKPCTALVVMSTFVRGLNLRSILWVLRERAYRSVFRNIEPAGWEFGRDAVTHCQRCPERALVHRLAGGGQLGADVEMRDRIAAAGALRERDRRGVFDSVSGHRPAAARPHDGLACVTGVSRLARALIARLAGIGSLENDMQNGC